MTETPGSRSKVFTATAQSAVVRYQVQDVNRSVEFYTQLLGFDLLRKAGPIGIVARGDLQLLLSGPSSSGSRPVTDGRRQESGGWNRIVLYVEDIDSTISDLRLSGATFRNELESGPGGKQIQLEDPDGNPIELHEAPQD